MSARQPASGASRSWHRLAEVLVARRRLVLLAAAAVAVVSIALARGLPLESDFSRLLPPSAESVRQLRQVEARTLVPSTFMIGVESNEPAARGRGARSLRRRLAELPTDLVEAVTFDEGVPHRFVWQNRFLFASLADLEAARDAIDTRIQEQAGLFTPFDTPSDDHASKDDSLDSLRRRLREAKEGAENPPERVSADGRLQLAIVRSPFSSDDTGCSRRLVDALEKVLTEVRADVGPQVTLGMTGDAITSLAENRALLNGMLISTLCTVALVLGALLLFYRTVLGVGALAWALSVGALATFAFARLAVGHLNLASAFLSSIVIGNGINFGILLLARYLEERRGGRHGAEAIGAAMAGSAPGTIAAATAAAAAYGSLAITDFRGFRDFGIIGGVGMLLCWVATYTVLPAALAAVDHRVRVTRAAPLGEVLGKLVPPSPWAIAAIGIALFVGTAAMSVRYLTHEPLENNLRNLRSTTTDLEAASAWMDKFDHAFGHGISGGFVLAVGRRDEAPRLAERLRAFDEGKGERQRLLSRITTLDDLLPSNQAEKLAVLDDIRTRLDRNLLPRAKPADRDELLELRPPEGLRALGDADVPRDLAWPFTERDGQRGRLVLANTGLGVDMWSVKDVERFTRTVRSMGLGPDVLVGGSAFVFSDMLDAMERDGPRATLAAMLGALAIVVLAVGWGRYALVTGMCSALGTFALLTVASWIGLKVNFLDFVALPITIGIGVDYSVNIASRARESGSGRMGVIGTGAAVLLCSYTTVVGYASLLFSANRGIRSFGLSAMIGELTCIATALVFAPAFVDALERILQSHRDEPRAAQR